MHSIMAKTQGAYESELVLIAANSLESLIFECSKIAEFLEQAPGASLLDVAYTCAQNYLKCINEPSCKTLAVVASSVKGLRSHLNTAIRRIENGTGRIRDRSGIYYSADPLLGEDKEGRIAFILPGAISFYPDMLRSLVLKFPSCRSAFDELEEAMAGDPHFHPSSFIFPPASYYRHDADIFASGAYSEAMASCYSACAAMVRLFRSFSINPDGVTGFAGGEMCALALAGASGDFPREEKITFLRDLYNVVDSAVTDKNIPSCEMLLVLMPHPEKLEELIKSLPPEKVQCAVRFSPKQISLAVAPDYIEELSQRLTAEGARLKKMTVERPFNTSWVNSLVPAWRDFSSRWVRSTTKIPVYSCVKAKPFSDDIKEMREEAALQWSSQIKFDDTIRCMYDDGFRVFIEAGPRGLLCTSIDETLTGKPHVALAADGIHRVGFLQLLHTLAALTAHGAKINPMPLFEKRMCKTTDFSSPLTLDVRHDSELRLPRSLPTFVLGSSMPGLITEEKIGYASTEPGTRRKASERAAAAAKRAKVRQQQFDFGSTNPLVSDAVVLEQSPGVYLEVTKEFSFQKEPFLADFARGTSQISFSDPKLKGLTLFPLVVGAEVMAELAQMLIPGRVVVKVNDLMSRRTVAFVDNKLKLFIRAGRVSGEGEFAAVRVQIRDDSPNSAWTWPLMEGTFLLSSHNLSKQPCVVPQLSRPRNVHWSSRDIYPDKLFAGECLRCITGADVWSEEGLNYDVEIPSSANAVAHASFPLWVLDPILLESVLNGFALWRSNAKFGAAFSLAFRLRSLSLFSTRLPEKMKLHCYLRFTGVTPRSHLADILVSDGNGNLVMELNGYEELTERVPEAYGKLILSPSTTYLTEELPKGYLDEQAPLMASAIVTDVPYNVFERNEELWMKTISQVVLNPMERKQLAEMTGSTNRRTEWLFGRIAAKEAVRRFLEKHFQARWSGADVHIWADDSGKPHPLGEWRNFLNSSIDLAIAHTAQFVVAYATSNTRVGVDVEDVSRDLSEEFTRGVFTTEELDLVVNATNTPSAILRFWCAKEALSKALGTGIRYSPKEMIIESFVPETGAIKMVLTGQWIEAFKQFKGRVIDVSSCIVRGHVLASCFIPESFFT